MTGAVAILATVCVLLAASVVGLAIHAALERKALIDAYTAERRDLLDAVLSRHAGDVKGLRRIERPPTETAEDIVAEAYKADRDRDLRAMGYEPADVPMVPSGLDGG